MKSSAQYAGKLEMAIVIALLVLVVVIVIAVKVNQGTLPEKEPLYQKVEEKEVVTVKKLTVAILEVEFPEQVKGREFTKHEEEKLKVERERFIEEIRQRQMEQLRANLRELTTEGEEEGVTSEEKPTTIFTHNIYPSEEDINKMEAEKALLY